MLEKVKEKARGYLTEITDDWIKSAITGVIAATVAGVYALFSDWVPAELKEADYLFIAAVHVVFIVSPLISIFLVSSWVLRLLLLLVPFAVVASAFNVYQHKVLHGLDLIEGNKIVVLLPDETEDPKTRNVIEDLDRTLPNAISSPFGEIELVLLPSRFTGKLNGTRLGRYLNSQTDLLAYIEVEPVGSTLFLSTKIPAIEKYEKLGLAWFRTRIQNQPQHKIEFTAKQDRYTFTFGISEEKSRFNHGVPSASLDLAFGASENKTGLDEIEQNRLLPMDDTLEIDADHLSPGIYFAATMSAAAYARLLGYQAHFCNYLDEFLEYEKENPEFDYLSLLNPKIAYQCLVKKDVKLVARLMPFLSSKQQRQVTQKLLMRVFESDQSDKQITQFDFMDPQQLAWAKALRKRCEIPKYKNDVLRTPDCLSFYLKKPEAPWAENVAMKEVIARYGKQSLRPLEHRLLSSVNRKTRRFYFFTAEEFAKHLPDYTPCNIPFWLLAYPAFLENMSHHNTLEAALHGTLNEFRDYLLQLNCPAQTSDKLTLKPLILDQSFRHQFFDEAKTLFADTDYNTLSLNQLNQALFYRWLPWILSHRDTLNLAPALEKLDINPQAPPAVIQRELTQKLLKLYQTLLVDNLPDDLQGELKAVEQELKSQFDPDRPLSEMAQALDDADNETLYLKSLQKTIKKGYKILQQAEGYFLDPYPNELIELFFTVAIRTQSFEQFALAPRKTPNVLHRVGLYRALNLALGDPERSRLLLERMTQDYPDETDSLRFLHYVMLTQLAENDIQGSLQSASSLEAQSLGLVRGYYRFAIRVVKAAGEAPSPQSTPACAAYKANNDADWTEFLIQTQTAPLFQHLSGDTVNNNIWKKIASYSRWQQLTDEELDERFIRGLSYYLKQFAGSLTEESPQTADDPLNDFEKLVLQTRAACL